MALKPKNQRDSLDVITTRLRRELSRVPGGRLILVPAQDIRVGGRQTNAAYQYTLQADSTAEVFAWAPKLLEALQHDPALTDVNSDQQQAGLETLVQIDRPTASRLGLTVSQIDNTLYDAFGQRSVSTIYNALNQYHVVMEVAPQYWQDPEILNQIWVSTSGGTATGTSTTNAPSGTVTAPTTTTAASANGINDSARNAAQNALAASGSSSASSGAPPSARGRRRWCRWQPWRISAAGIPRCRSITRASLWRPPSRSIWRRANPCRMHRPRSTRR